MKPCHCSIRHARTPKERERASKMLDDACRIKDDTGITVLLAALAPCKSDEATDILNEPVYALKEKS